MKILKFGGKSLANGEALINAINIVTKEAKQNKVVVVCSARGNATNELEIILNKSVLKEDYNLALNDFIDYQTKGFNIQENELLIAELKTLLKGVSILEDYSQKIKDKILAYGELLAVNTVSYLLKNNKFKTAVIDARKVLKTAEKNNETIVLQKESEKNTLENINFEAYDITIVTGFIASDLKNNTTTLGRNGSNYTATLLANFLNAKEVLNYTNVDGIYTANPTLVENAQIIPELSYREANELANFGTEIIHAKTIHPLIEKNIPIKILNSLNPNSKGTTISHKSSVNGLKAITVIKNVALIGIEGGGLLGKVGIDARIFNSLSNNNISVRTISQASSERGIGFIVDDEDADLAKQVLTNEFKEELELNDISDITVNKNIGIISVIGRHNDFIDKIYTALKKNDITPYLINNTINGKHISLVIDKKLITKGVNVLHNYIFGAHKTLNVLVYGVGNVGNVFINQLIENKDRILKRKNLKINIIGIANSKRLLLNANGISDDWTLKLSQSTTLNNIENIKNFIEAYNLENLVAVDNTSSKTLVGNYTTLVDLGFELIASNKIANTISYNFYDKLRDKLKSKNKNFLYETNVGAGLPLVDTIKQLHDAGDKIVKIRGVFSGSLSYIFNKFSDEKKDFFSILKEAGEKGFTEPDPREDLSGNDVARKLLILSREIDYKHELTDVDIESLIPDTIKKETSIEDFFKEEALINQYYENKIDTLNENEVLRYIGDLNEEGKLSVKLTKVEKNSNLGNLRGADSIFEIYTESYGDNPIVIQGAGAGSEVTARGVYSDLLRISAIS